MTTQNRNEIKITPFGQCWLEVDACHESQLRADGLIADKMFDVGFHYNQKTGKFETTVQSGVPAKAEKLGYDVIWPN